MIIIFKDNKGILLDGEYVGYYGKRYNKQNYKF